MIILITKLTEYMDQDTLQKIKANLLEQKSEIENDLKNFTSKDNKVEDNYSSKFPEFGNDEDENANEVAEYSDRLSLEHVLEKRLRDVKQALESLEEGNYGICKYCGKEIEPQRLLARPTSSSCVECKKKLTGEE